MIQDIFVPSKIGSYYIFSKRVLGFEITTSSIQASLIYFSRTKVVLENSMTIPLRDSSEGSIVNAIKKIATTIGKYDEVVTSLTSSAVIFKELTLPFLGKDKIAMIVNYEVEPLLPFSLDEAVIDFLITDENKEKSQTTILVAAARKTDLYAYTSYFEKAGVQLYNVTLDMFALYDFYRHTMYVPQAYTSLLVVDFGIDAIRILYIQKGVLQSVRLIPYGLAGMMKKIDKNIESLPYDSIEDILEQGVNRYSSEKQHHITEKIIADFSKQILLSISFFQKQIKNFTPPARVICLGAGTELKGFLDESSAQCNVFFELLDIKRVAHRNNIEIEKKIKVDAQHSASLIISLACAYYGNVNFLSNERKKIYGRLLYRQLFVALFISIATIACFYFYSQHELKKWNNAYNKSKKEVVQALQDQMDVDVKTIKRITEIVSAAQNKYQQAKKICFSFSQTNNSFLHYLQELCGKIDRTSLGLDLKKLSIHDKEVFLQGKVKDFDALQTFEEELMELENFIIKDRPRELSFTVRLEVKEDQEG